MSFAKKFLTLAAPAALLALGGCATGFPAQVSRFQHMPPPAGQSFVIHPADAGDRGGIEFGQYADLVRRHLAALGYQEAPSDAAASLVVTLDYGVDHGRQQLETRPALGGWGRWGGGWGGWGGGWGGWGRSGFHRPFGWGGGYRSPFYWGWDDPFWGTPSEIDVRTVYTAFLDLDIKRAADGQSVFEGSAKARAGTDRLQALVPNLVDAMFTGFPGNSGETVRITVPPPPRQPR
jgi:hypothetical protein